MSLKIRTAVVAVLAGASLMLAGCATTTQSPLDNHNDLEGKLVVAPVMPDYKVEVTLAKLNEILSAVELTNEQRARFHYDRGVIYDSVGLRLLARIDFMQALKLQPDLLTLIIFLVFIIPKRASMTAPMKLSMAYWNLLLITIMPI